MTLSNDDIDSLNYDQAVAEVWRLTKLADSLDIQLAEARAELEATRAVRNEWCAEYKKARDERDALRAENERLREALEESQRQLRALAFNTDTEWDLGKAMQDAEEFLPVIDAALAGAAP